MTMYATDFSEIPATLAANQELRQAVLYLIAVQSMAGKVTEGGDRLDRLRAILSDLVSGRLTLPKAYQRVEHDLPRHTSNYDANNRVFPDGWAERLVRTQYSRFYSQAVMERLLADGQTHCLVPHSSGENADSKCSQQLAGGVHPLRPLYDRLISSYAQGNWGKEIKIPEHPHCTHVIAPSHEARH